MKTIILTILTFFVFIYITGCDGAKPFKRYSTKIESYNPPPGEKMCMYFIDSAFGELTLPVGDTICIKCGYGNIDSDRVDYYCAILWGGYVSPVEGIEYYVRSFGFCRDCPLADGVYLRKYRLK